MLSTDPTNLVDLRRLNLLAEAEQDRLAALLPSKTSGLRHDLALACYRLATWLETSSTSSSSLPGEYVQPAETGLEDWVRA